MALTGYSALQVDPQLIPAGREVTTPLPLTATLRATGPPPMGVNAAVTLRTVVAAKVQEGVVPAQAPPHPVTLWLAPAVAVRVTLVSAGKSA